MEKSNDLLEFIFAYLGLSFIIIWAVFGFIEHIYTGTMNNINSIFNLTMFYLIMIFILYGVYRFLKLLAWSLKNG